MEKNLQSVLYQYDTYTYISIVLILVRYHNCKVIVQFNIRYCYSYSYKVHTVIQVRFNILSTLTAQKNGIWNVIEKKTTQNYTYAKPIITKYIIIYSRCKNFIWQFLREYLWTKRWKKTNRKFSPIPYFDNVLGHSFSEKSSIIYVRTYIHTVSSLFMTVLVPKFTIYRIKTSGLNNIGIISNKLSAISQALNWQYKISLQKNKYPIVPILL